jgi:hypothetical protein
MIEWQTRENLERAAGCSRPLTFFLAGYNESDGDEFAAANVLDSMND